MKAARLIAIITMLISRTMMPVHRCTYTPTDVSNVVTPTSYEATMRAVSAAAMYAPTATKKYQRRRFKARRVAQPSSVRAPRRARSGRRTGWAARRHRAQRVRTPVPRDGGSSSVVERTSPSAGDCGCVVVPGG